MSMEDISMKATQIRLDCKQRELCSGFATLLLSASAAPAQTTGFTCQGKLSDNGNRRTAATISWFIRAL